MIESDDVLQKFSGKFYTTKINSHSVFPNSITDSLPSLQGGVAAHNIYDNSKYLMGVCTGCHGNAANNGSDYSFIFDEPVGAPLPTRQVTSKEVLLKNRTPFPSRRK